MITEQQVFDVLPSHGFIRTYVEHASRQTTSPLGYHLGTALTILATTCPQAYGMPYAGMLRPNLFTLLVGRSGEDQKSTSLNIGKRLLQRAVPELIGDYPASAEGLIESVSHRPCQLIPMSEFGKFLSAAQRGYYEPVKTALTDLWDCEDVQRARAGGRTIRADDPRLSVLAACSIPYLEKHTLSEDWTGGFMGRWLVLYCRRERLDPDPVGDPRMETWIQEELFRRASIGGESVGQCIGLAPDASEFWADWFHDLYNRIGISTNIQGVLSRVPTIARKIALLYAWDFGIPVGVGQWEMPLEILFKGVQTAELHLKSLIGLFDRIADNPDARLRRQVLTALETYGGEAPLGAIIRHLKIRKRLIVEIIEGLVEERTVHRHGSMDGGFVYRISNSYEDG